jgi:diacylglycerol kinase family enzyme
LTDLGIGGKVGRLALFKDAGELIRDEIRRGVDTVVFVGNDETVKKTLQIMPEVKATFGLIPMGEEKNSLARMLGLPAGLEACNVLSARIVKSLDVAKVNERYFLFRILIPRTNISIRCDKMYNISPTESGDIEIRNWGAVDKKEINMANPEDGLLDLVIHAKVGKKESSTDLKLKNIEIKTKEQIPLYIDGERVNGNNFKIKTAPAKVRWIVGKKRLF